MKILAICHQYDSNSPGGIINKKVLKGLSTSNEIKIISAITNSLNTQDVELYICSRKPYQPHKFFSKVGDFIGKNIDDIFWEINAKNKIKKILKEWTPDVIYSRGQPLSPLNIGYHISKEYDIPLMIHFSDPLPAPIEWKPEKKYREKILNGIKPILSHSKKISFVTQEMIDYQEEVSNINIMGKSVVLHNPLSDVKNIDEPNKGKTIFLFIGSFYGNRKPDSLLDSFLEFSNDNKNCELHIVGNNKHLNEYNSHQIKILPFSSNPYKLMENSHILLDIDSNTEREVFLSSKLLDYLSIDRIIMSITPKKSPARDILNKLDKSAIISTHNKKDIIKSFQKAISVKWDKELFDERKEIREELSLNSIIKKTTDELKSCLKKKN